MRATIEPATDVRTIGQHRATALRSRWTRRPALAVLALLAATTSCATPEPRRREAPSTELRLEAITAPVSGRGERELDSLRREVRNPAARLREAFISSNVGDRAAALKILNELVFGGESYGPSVEAFARFLRADVFERAGERDRATHERRVALGLAIDRELRERLQAKFDAPAETRPVEVPRGSLSILARTAWNATRPRVSEMRPLERATRVTVHHSANLTRATDQRSSTAAIRAIQRHHMDQNGWGDIGYHFLIDPAGRVWNGRSLEWQGAHAGDPEKNRHNIGVCLLGNFVPNEQGAPPQAQIDALETLLTALCERYGLRPENILTHRELRPTSCPGPYLQAATERIRDSLRSYAAPAGSH